MKVVSNETSAAIIQQVKRHENELKNFVETVMVEGIDYGTIPKTNKRCLHKSGAEKLCIYYEYGKRFEIINRETVLEQEYFSYEIKAILFDSASGQIVAEGVGSCNSKEKKYLKSTGYDAANTVLKMAKKRAFVDAVLTATASSDMFTQDLTDDDSSENKDASKNQNNQQGNSKNHDKPVQMLSSKQQDYLYSLMSQRRITIEQVRNDLNKRYGIKDIKELSREQASEYIKILKETPARVS